MIEHPRAVAIVLGHLGADEGTMQTYSQWYTDRKCSVVTGTSPVTRFVLNQSLRPTAMAILQETGTLLKSTPSTVPVVVHLFSNGGAFLLDEMEEVLLQQHQPQQQQEASSTTEGESVATTTTTAATDYALILERMKLGYQFYDSCPCYIRQVWDWKHGSQSFPFRTWSSWGRGLYTAAAATSLTVWNISTLSWNRPAAFWNRRMNSRVCLQNNIYAYTTADFASDAFWVEQLMEYRTTQLKANCVALRFEDSTHCKLDRDHPVEYNQAIDTALETALQRSATTTKDSPKPVDS